MIPRKSNTGRLPEIEPNPALYFVGSVAPIIQGFLAAGLRLPKGDAMIGLLDILEAYEAGYLDTRETFDLFAELIRAERVWNLEKPYPQTARHLIAAGYLTPDGKITKRGRAWIVDEGREGYPWDVNPRIDGASDEPIPRCFWAPGAAA